MKPVLYFVIVTALLTTGYIFFLQPGKNNPDFVHSLDANPEIFERNFLVVQPPHSVFLADTSQIFQPAQIRQYNSHVYLNDFSDFIIYEYDEEGKLNNVLKLKRGRGPGEFQNVTDFDIINNTLWAVDSQRLMIHSFSLDSLKHLNSISVDRRPMRITCMKDGFVVQWLGTELLFSTFDYEGNELHQFGKVIEDQLRNTLSLDGTIRSNHKDRFVYVPFYASLIYHYRQNGELINVLKAPDGIQFPATRKQENLSFAPDFSFYQDAFFDDENNLYVFTELPGKRNNHGDWEGERRNMIDKYNLIDGRYVSSLEFLSGFISATYNPKESILYTSDFAKAYIHTFSEDISF